MQQRYNPDIHHRRSIRLSAYDYTQAGAYFVTLCAHHWACVFGHIDNNAMVLSAYGDVVLAEWLQSAAIRSEIRLGAYVIMPNHLHAIVSIVNDSRRGDRPVALPRPPTHTGPASQSLSALIAGFKSAVTKRINAIRHTPGRAVWQRNYYEHVIRNEADYLRIAAYIADNPRSWHEDTLHPAKHAGATSEVGGTVVTTAPVGTQGEPRQPGNREGDGPVAPTK